MRKLAKRFSRKRGNIFIARLRDDLFALGAMHSDGLVSFSRRFLTDPQDDIPPDAFDAPLFTVSVQMTFFSKSDIYPAGQVAESVLAAIPLSTHVIKPYATPFDPDNPFGLHGPYPWKGGALVELKDPMYPASSSTGRFIRHDLDGVRDSDVIVKTEMSGLYINFELKERLAACHEFGGVVDAHKARTFPECAALQNDVVKQTSLFLPHKMPLLGLKFDLDQNTWVAA